MSIYSAHWSVANCNVAKGPAHGLNKYEKANAFVSVQLKRDRNRIYQQYMYVSVDQTWSDIPQGGRCCTHGKINRINFVKSLLRI